MSASAKKASASANKTPRSTAPGCVTCRKLHKKCSGKPFPCRRCKDKGIECVEYVRKKRGPKVVLKESATKKAKVSSNMTKKQKLEAFQTQVDFMPDDSDVGVFYNIGATMATIGASANAFGQVVGDALTQFKAKIAHEGSRVALYYMLGCRPFPVYKIKPLAKHLPSDKPGCIFDALKPFSERIIHQNNNLKERMYGGTFNVASGILAIQVKKKLSENNMWRLPEGGIKLEGPFEVNRQTAIGGKSAVIKNVHIHGGYHHGAPENTRVMLMWCDFVEESETLSFAQKMIAAIVKNFRIQPVMQLANWRVFVDEFMESVPAYARKWYAVYDFAAVTGPTNGLVLTNIPDEHNWTANDAVTPVSTYVDDQEFSILSLVKKYMVGGVSWQKGWKSPDVISYRQDGSGEIMKFKKVRVYSPRQGHVLYTLRCKVIAFCFSSYVVETCGTPDALSQLSEYAAEAMQAEDELSQEPESQEQGGSSQEQGGASQEQELEGSSQEQELEPEPQEQGGASQEELEGEDV